MLKLASVETQSAMGSSRKDECLIINVVIKINLQCRVLGYMQLNGDLG